jgi:hypothetical protein
MGGWVGDGRGSRARTSGHLAAALANTTPLPPSGQIIWRLRIETEAWPRLANCRWVSLLTHPNCHRSLPTGCCAMADDDPEAEEKPVQALDAGDIALLKSYVRVAPSAPPPLPCLALFQSSTTPTTCRRPRLSPALDDAPSGLLRAGVWTRRAWGRTPRTSRRPKTTSRQRPRRLKS